MSIMTSSKPPRPTMEGLQRTRSEMSSFQFLTREIIDQPTEDNTTLPTVSEVELAKCECCGMSEECTSEYIEKMKEKCSGKVICGLCSEAVKEEMEKNGGRSREEALEEHMSACVRFNRLGRDYPALYQADAVRKLLKKSATTRANKSTRKGIPPIKGGIARSSSCIPAITQDMQDKLRV